MDVSEFECFLQEYEKDIFSFCCYLTMNSDKADDLYQDTVLQAFEMIEKIDVSNNPKSFFFSIAVGKWKNARRKTKRRNKIAPTILFGDFTGDLIGGIEPEHQTQITIFMDCINATLSKMDDKFKIPLILFYFDGCNDDSISKICNIPKGTVKSRLHKGRKILKEALEKEGFNYE